MTGLSTLLPATVELKVTVGDVSDARGWSTLFSLPFKPWLLADKVVFIGLTAEVAAMSGGVGGGLGR